MSSKESIKTDEFTVTLYHMVRIFFFSRYVEMIKSNECIWSLLGCGTNVQKKEKIKKQFQFAFFFVFHFKNDPSANELLKRWQVFVLFMVFHLYVAIVLPTEKVPVTFVNNNDYVYFVARYTAYVSLYFYCCFSLLFSFLLLFFQVFSRIYITHIHTRIQYITWINAMQYNMKLKIS